MNVENEMVDLEVLTTDHPEVRQLSIDSPEFNAAIADIRKKSVVETNEEDITPAGDEIDEVEGSDENADDQDETEEHSEEDGEDDSGKPRSLKRKLAKARQREREAREELDRMKAERAPAQPAQQEVRYGDPAPELDAFETYAAWQDALMDWKIEQRDLKKENAAQSTKVQTDWNAKEAVFREEMPDYDKVTKDATKRLNLQLDDLVAFIECENGPAVLDALMRDPKVMEKFNSSSIHRRIAMIGHLDLSIDSGETTEVKSTSTKLSSSPPPRFPKGYAKTKLDPIADVLEMDDATWIKMMDQRDADKRRHK